MKGYQLTFFTQQNCHHRGKHVCDWLIDSARELGVRGGTVLAATEGFGHNGKMHSSHFFELADQPEEITMVVTEDEAERLLKRLLADQLHIFYVKIPVEFGTLGESD